MHFYDPPKNLQKPLIQLKLGSFGCKKTFGGMVLRCMPKYGSGGPPGTSFMTIFGFYVSAQIPNIDYFEVYGGLQIHQGLIGSSINVTKGFPFQKEFK